MTTGEGSRTGRGHRGLAAVLMLVAGLLGSPVTAHARTGLPAAAPQRRQPPPDPTCHLHARQSHRYYAVVYEGTDPATGKERHRWYPGGATRREAEKVLGDLVKHIHDGDYRAPERITLGNYSSSAGYGCARASSVTAPTTRTGG